VAGNEERPCLRPELEPTPVVVDGSRLIALRDPDRYTEETALVEPGVLGLLALFDGARTLEDIRVELARQGAGFIGVEMLQALVDSLDRCYLLDNERYHAAARAREEEFASAPARAATHAGAAYPEEAAEAREFLQGMLDLAEGPRDGTVARLIAPHIDLQLGAEVYGHAHRRLLDSGRPDVVVVLGVCHAPTQRRFIVCRKDFETPLGLVRHDAVFVDALEKRVGEELTQEQLAHKAEHSVEFQALWLAHLWPEDPPALVPILVGSFEEFVRGRASPSINLEIEAFIEALRETIGAEERRVVVIASVDFAHLGPRYGDQKGLDEADEELLETRDRSLLEHVLAGDAEAFFREVASDGNARNVCGTAPVYVTLRIGEGEGELLRYGQGRIDPASGSVVSFAAVSFDR
jgi:AmmeMemoRadiSam system protein B